MDENIFIKNIIFHSRKEQSNPSCYTIYALNYSPSDFASQKENKGVKRTRDERLAAMIFTFLPESEKGVGYYVIAAGKFAPRSV